MAEQTEDLVQNKSALEIPGLRRSSTKSQTGSESSEIILSGDESWGSSGFRSGQTSDLGEPL